MLQYFGNMKHNFVGPHTFGVVVKVTRQIYLSGFKHSLGKICYILVIWGTIWLGPDIFGVVVKVTRQIYLSGFKHSLGKICYILVIWGTIWLGPDIFGVVVKVIFLLQTQRSR